jgi:hypothetical protein
VLPSWGGSRLLAAAKIIIRLLAATQGVSWLLAAGGWKLLADAERPPADFSVKAEFGSCFVKRRFVIMRSWILHPALFKIGDWEENC